MKSIVKLIFAAVLLSGCIGKNSNGTYVSHIDGTYSIADDTLILTDSVVTNRSGYQKIRNGKLLPKAYKIRKWTLGSPDAPVMEIRDNEIQIGHNFYQKLP